MGRKDKDQTRLYLRNYYIQRKTYCKRHNLCILCCRQLDRRGITCSICLINHNKNSKASYNKAKDDAFNSYGGYTCVHCGEVRHIFLCLDHINGGGRAHMRQINNNLYTWLRKNKYPVGLLQVLCYNCNQIKLVKSGVKDTVSKVFETKLKQLILSKYGTKCVCCGFSNINALCVDHINNNGADHRREIGLNGGGKKMYLWLRENNFPSGYQTMCQNCNQGKKLNNNICPHQI